jgi:glutathione synthase/RimK-type ligase-like ATP-grasp enzyme
MRRTIAFVTYRERPEVTADDAFAVRALVSLGIDVVGIPWDQENIDWGEFEAVVLRSCWDYFHRPSQFLSWIDRLHSQGINLLNEHDIVRWNAEKTYLKDLMRAGAPVVPTVYAAKDQRSLIADVLREQGWERAAIKPTVSGTSLHTWVSSPATEGQDQQRLDELLKERGMMLQKYLPEIETEGELSLIYFDSEFSHAIRKVPRPGDFRVQSDFGGTWTSVNPDRDVLRQADEVVRVSGRDSVYARVDGVIHEGKFLLMELEMIEPDLFLESNAEAPMRFARAIQGRLGKPSGIK